MSQLMCPRCKQRMLDPDPVKNTISIRDNTTMICPDCSMKEYLIDAKKLPQDTDEIHFCEEIENGSKNAQS